MGLVMTTVRRNLGSVDDYTAAIDDAARRYGLDPDVLRALISVESSGNPEAKGAAGEVGLMQVMPSTAQSVDPAVSPHDLWDPLTNIDVGAHYLADQLARYGGNLVDAISAYNAGHATDANQSYVDKVLGYLPGTSETTGPLDVSRPVDWLQEHWLLALGLGVSAWMLLRGRR